MPVLDDDTPESLAQRVLVQEHKIYPEVIQLFAQHRVRVEGHRVRILSAPGGKVQIAIGGSDGQSSTLGK